jgi:hypothetical protein
VIWVTWCVVHWPTIPLCEMRGTVNSCHATFRNCCARADYAVVFNWTKRPSDALRKRREGGAEERLANTLPDRLLPERPSLDGYTVREVSLDQVAQLFKSKCGTA